MLSVPNSSHYLTCYMSQIFTVLTFQGIGLRTTAPRRSAHHLVRSLRGKNSSSSADASIFYLFQHALNTVSAIAVPALSAFSVSRKPLCIKALWPAIPPTYTVYASSSAGAGDTEESLFSFASSLLCKHIQCTFKWFTVFKPPLSSFRFIQVLLSRNIKQNPDRLPRRHKIHPCYRLSFSDIHRHMTQNRLY